MRQNTCLCTVIAMFVLLMGYADEGLAVNRLMVEDRYGEPGQPGPHQPGLSIPVVGTWDDSLVAYTISLRFHPTFIHVHDVTLAGTRAEAAPHFAPQWNNDYGYVTAKVVMGTEFPGDEGNAIAPDTEGSPLLNIEVEINDTASVADSTALWFEENQGIPPRPNRFYWKGEGVVSPDTVRGWLHTIFVLFCNFEEDSCGFIPYVKLGTIQEWEWGPDILVNSENKVWGTDLDDRYNRNACYGLASPQIRVNDDDWEVAYLTFCHRHRISLSKEKDSADDGGNVQRKTGWIDPAWEVLYPDWGEYDYDEIWSECLEYKPGYSGVSDGYPAFIRAGYDLSGKDDASCSGTCYQVQWLFSSNEGAATVDTGWYIDDVRIACAPTTCGRFFIRGDVNKDGMVNSADLSLLNTYVRGDLPDTISIPPPCDRADVNDDGICCSWDDVAFLSNIIASAGLDPAWPYPDPGIDSSPDAIPTESCPRNPWQDSIFVRGDVQTDGDQDIFDAIYILNWLGGLNPAPWCIKTADVQDDGDADLMDAIYLLNWLGGINPAPPAPCCGIPGECGKDPTPDVLTCYSYLPCDGVSPTMDRTVLVGSAQASRLALNQAVMEDGLVVVLVSLSNVEPLIGFSFAVEYDPGVVRARNVDNSHLVTEGFDFFVGGVDEPGVVRVVAVSDLDMGDGVDRLSAGTHQVATIVFERAGRSSNQDVSLKMVNSVMAIDHERALRHRAEDGVIRATITPSREKE